MRGRVYGRGGGYCIFYWKRHICDYNDIFVLLEEKGKFYLYPWGVALRCLALKIVLSYT